MKRIGFFRKRVIYDLKNVEEHMTFAKYSLNYNQKREIINCIYYNLLPGKQYVFKGLIAKNINEIFSTKFIPFVEGKEIKFDFEWALLILNQRKQELNKYIALREKYEYLLLNGNIQAAEATLNNINEEITYSFWGIEQTMVCSELYGGFEHNRNKLSEIAEATNKYLILMLSEFYSYKAEVESTYSNFSHRLSNFFNQMTDKFDDVLIKDYLEFQFMLFNHNINEESLRRVLALSASLPIIDLYENFVKACSIILSSDLINEDIKDMVIQGIENLEVNDKRLKNMLLINNPDELDSITFDGLDIQVMEEIVEEYTKGNYDTCVDKIYEESKKGNNILSNFDILVLFVRSILNGGIDLQRFSLINDFLKENLVIPIFNIYSSKNKEENLNKILNTAKILGNISMRYKIESFYLSNVMPNNENTSGLNKRISDIFSSIITPQLVFSYKNIEEKQKFLNKFKKLNKYSETLKLLESFVLRTFDTKNLINIPISRLNYYKVKALRKDEVFSAKAFLKEIILKLKASEEENFSYYMFEYERIAKELFKIHIEMSNFKEAVDIVSDSYLLNKSTVIRMDKKKLSNLIENSMKNSNNIKKVIFDYIVNEKDYFNIYTSLINFLDEHNLKLPSELIFWCKENPQYLKEVQFILSKIYTKEVMKYFVRINPKQRNEERIKVLNYLLLTDKNKENKSKYLEEINNIMKAQSIQERIKSVDEKKIFVDTDAILIEFEDVFREKYRRYTVLKELKEELSYFDLIEATATIEKFSQAAILEFTENQEKKQRFLMYKELIQEFINEVLNNPKYGLGKFLSSRIRHGLLENNLSKTFKNYNLLSLKIDSEATEFVINKYWEEEISKYDNDITNLGFERIKSALGEFSKNIVNKIEEVKDWIRIADKTHQNGMFNYPTFFNESSLLILYGHTGKNIDYKGFYDEIINYFWELTEGNLELIRNRINGELYDYFVDV